MRDDCDKLSDEELVARALENAEDYRCIMLLYESRLGRYIRRIGGLSYEDAEDILQEVFLKAYENLRSFDNSYRLSTWLYRIAHNQTISHWRKHNKQKWDIALPEENETRWLALVDEIDIAEKVDQRILQTKVGSIIDQLPQHYKEVLWLRYWEGWDYKEMSDALHKPIGTIGTLLARAKKKFANILKENL
ncbi:MAG: RNA polymerase sigma factor [Candidatus Komeilibacteria bacterium]